MPEVADIPRAALERSLFYDGHTYVYAVADGAQIENLPEQLAKLNVQHECLFVGDVGQEIRQVAPYLIALNQGNPILDFLVDQGWGKGWAIYLRSELDLLDVRKHLRKLTLAEMPDGEVVFFRFYDPMTLRTIVPTMTLEQREFFFGDEAVLCYVCESETPGEILEFTLSDTVSG